MALNFPDSPSLNQQFTTGSRTWVWSGSAWVAYRGSSTITTGDTPPSAPATGSTWFNTTNGRTYVYYDSAWVNVSTSSIFATTILDNSAGDALTVTQSGAGRAAYVTGDVDVAGTVDATSIQQAGAAVALASDLSSHSSDTTAVHGIADTSLLETQSGAQTKATAAQTAAATALSSHEADTTNIHGIADTSALATKTYADTAASTAAANVVNSAPSTLDTLNELATALGNDANFATTVTNSIAGKVSKAGDTITGSLVVSGTTSTDLVRITQTGTGNAIVVEDSANPDATPFVVDASGNVGVGIATPEAALHVERDSDSRLRIAQNTPTTTSPAVVFVKRRGTAASPTIVADGDGLGDVNFFGYDGTTLRSGAVIRAAVDGTPGSADMPGRLVFFTTADGAASATERMRITSAGNVGIGLQAPTQTLHTYTAVTGGSPATSGSGNDPNAGARIQMASVALDVGTTAAGGAWLQARMFNNYANNFPLLLNPNGGNVGIGTSSPGAKLDVSGNLRFSAANPEIEFNNGGARIGNPNGVANTLTFHTGGGLGSTSNERMRIDSSGNVGIGKSSPGFKLDVNGAVNATSYLQNGAPLEMGLNPFFMVGV